MSLHLSRFHWENKWTRKYFIPFLFTCASIVVCVCKAKTSKLCILSYMFSNILWGSLCESKTALERYDNKALQCWFKRGVFLFVSKSEYCWDLTITLTDTRSNLLILNANMKLRMTRRIQQTTHKSSRGSTIIVWGFLNSKSATRTWQRFQSFNVPSVMDPENR